MQYIKATLLAKTKEVREDGSIVEVVVWVLSEPLPPCRHSFKYRLYYGHGGVDRVRYDNELGKGDHRHTNGSESFYTFVSIGQLLDDFERDIEDWRTS